MPKRVPKRNKIRPNIRHIFLEFRFSENNIFSMFNFVESGANEVRAKRESSIKINAKDDDGWTVLI